MFANIFTRNRHRATISLIKTYVCIRVDVVSSAWCWWITFFDNSIICKTISGLGTLPEGSHVTTLARWLTNVRTKSVVDLMHNASSGPLQATKRPAKNGTVCLRQKKKIAPFFTLYPFPLLFSLFTLHSLILSHLYCHVASSDFCQSNGQWTEHLTDG